MYDIFRIVRYLHKIQLESNSLNARNECIGLDSFAYFNETNIDPFTLYVYDRLLLDNDILIIYYSYSYSNSL